MSSTCTIGRSAGRGGAGRGGAGRGGAARKCILPEGGPGGGKAVRHISPAFYYSRFVIIFIYLPRPLITLIILITLITPQSACVAPLLKELYGASSLARTGVVLTIHNIAFQVRHACVCVCVCVSVCVWTLCVRTYSECGRMRVYIVWTYV
jgi:hypothetical protein